MRDPRIDPRPGDVVGARGLGGKKAKCFGLTTVETESKKEVDVLLDIGFIDGPFTGRPHTRSLNEWRKLVAGAEVLHVAD